MNSSLERPRHSFHRACRKCACHEDEQSSLWHQRNDQERKCQKRAALVFIHGHSQIAKTNTEEGVRQIEAVHRVDVTACGVNGGFVREQRAKQIVKARRQIAQTRAQIQNIWSGECCAAAWLENTINFAEDLSEIFQVRNRFDQPGMPLSISVLVGNFFTNINSR